MDFCVSRNEKNKSLFQIRKRLQEYQKQIVKAARDEGIASGKDALS